MEFCNHCRIADVYYPKTLVKTMHLLVQDFSCIVFPTEYCCVFLQQDDEESWSSDNTWEL